MIIIFMKVYLIDLLVIKYKYIFYGECLIFLKVLNKNWVYCLENYKDVFLNKLLFIKFRNSFVYCFIMDSLKERVV